MQELNLKIAGLFTHPSELSAPEGGLSIADNIVIDREGTAQPRRGYDRLANSFTPGTARAHSLFFFQGSILAHYNTNKLAYYAAGWTDLSGTFTPITGSKMRVGEASQNLYITTNAGILKMDKPTSTPTKAGAYKGLDVVASQSANTSTWLEDKYHVAYRVVWGYKDNNKNLILGSPSQREVFKNTGGALKAVDIRTTIPDGITPDWFVQLYRSMSVENTTQDIEPSDELGLVYETNPTSTDISNGYISFTDITPDELRGAVIYTAATQEGLVSQNERPPMAQDIAVFKNVMFYANTTSKHRKTVTLLGVDGSNGLVLNETIKVGAITYTCKATETVASAEFQQYTGGSASQNIRDTALSLVRVINQHNSSSVYAYYQSGPDGLPGKVLLEERGIGGAAFNVITNNATAWSPDLVAGEDSTNDRYKHALYYSKNSEPEAVPLPNYFFAGSADKAILRIVPLRDSLFIFKEDGIYRLSGEDSSSFRLDLFDSTAKLMAPETCAVLNNQIFCLSDQGVVSVTESGVQVRSRPIENSLLSIQGINPTVLKSESFGIGYETDRKYILSIPEAAGDTGPTQSFVFNTFTNTWTRWTLAKGCGGVNPADDKLYFGDSEGPHVSQERKSFNFTDYVDYALPTVISAVSGTTLTLSSSDRIKVGDVIWQSGSVYSIVVNTDPAAGTATMAFTASFTPGNADVLNAIDSHIAWIPLTAKNPGILKHYREVTMLFRSDFTGTGTLTFSSDISASPENETLEGTPVGQWGLFPWGVVPWGGDRKRKAIRVYIPRNKQRCSQLTIEFKQATGYANYQLNGLSIVANPGSERVTN